MRKYVFKLGEPTWTDQEGRHSSPRSMFIRPNYKLGNGSDHDNAKKYGPLFCKFLLGWVRKSLLFDLTKNGQL